MKKLNEGKTKIVWLVNENDNHVVIESKDNITAGDGAKHDVIEGKAIFANKTTCSVFQLLKKCNIPLAFIEQINNTKFRAEKCGMIDLEVVVRREAHGSYLNRCPWLTKGHIFPQLVVELFLKTSGKKYKGHDLPVDDPLMIIEGKRAKLYLPKVPINQQEPFLILDDFPLRDSPDKIEQIRKIATEVFLILEKVWALAGKKLVDFKLEFGINSKGELKLADVIDNDSWRVVDTDNQYIDKQLYRDGGDLDRIIANYKLVAELTGHFRIPRQQIILWRGSESDNFEPFYKAIEDYGAGGMVQVTEVTCSMHKTPVRGCLEITKLVQENPDSVLIVYVGRSNGAGPTLSAEVTIPTITVPVTFKEFPEDVWSSLRTPSDVPLLTMLEPKNAMLAALTVLAMRNPQVYCKIRFRQEKRLINIVKI